MVKSLLVFTEQHYTFTESKNNCPFDGMEYLFSFYTIYERVYHLR